MRNRTIMGIIVLLALLTWGGLVTYMNRQPPIAGNQFVFLVIWSGAVLFTVMPLSYVLNARYATPLGRVGDMNRALRQGLLTGLMAGLLMALHILRMLPPERALVLVVIVILVETLSYIRR